MPRYLADTSIWAWAQKRTRTDIRGKLADRFESGEVVTCVPVVLEAMHRPDTSARYEEQFERLFEPLEWLPLDRAGVERAIQIQRELAAKADGGHRRPAIDFLIAAAAEAAGPEVALWFFDRDLEVICDHTGQPSEAEASTGAGH